MVGEMQTPITLRAKTQTKLRVDMVLSFAFLIWSVMLKNMKEQMVPTW